MQFFLLLGGTMMLYFNISTFIVFYPNYINKMELGSVFTNDINRTLTYKSGFVYCSDRKKTTKHYCVLNKDKWDQVLIYHSYFEENY